MLIDTNVWSELNKVHPDLNVRRWLRAHKDRTVLSTLVIAELRLGPALAGNELERARLIGALNVLLADLAERICPFDLKSALVWGELTGMLRRSGRTLPDVDTLIAAQAIAHGMAVVTRNVKHFEPTGVRVINPWRA